MIVYALYFNEWGWDEGDENSGYILGIFTDKNTAILNMIEAKKENDHGGYEVKTVEVNKYRREGF
jgi:hypothetical protein